MSVSKKGFAKVRPNKARSTGYENLGQRTCSPVVDFGPHDKPYAATLTIQPSPRLQAYRSATLSAIANAGRYSRYLPRATTQAQMSVAPRSDR